MLDIGWTEMVVIGAVAILVVGPRELPGMLRTFGRYMGQIRRMAGEFQSQMNDALKEAELDEVRRGIESVRSASPSKALRKELGALKEAGDSVRKAVEDPGAPKPGTAAKPASAAKPGSQGGETSAGEAGPVAKPDPAAAAPSAPEPAKDEKVAAAETAS